MTSTRTEDRGASRVRETVLATSRRQSWTLARSRPAIAVFSPDRLILVSDAVAALSEPISKVAAVVAQSA